MRIVLITLLAAIAACTGIGETTLKCDNCIEVQVNRVIDGDTLDTARGRVRLFGVDTSEGGQRCYSKATKRLRQLAGNSIRLELGPRIMDQYGRLLAYVYTEAGLSIDEILIREGLARAWTRDGQHRDLLIGLELKAKISNDGCLW